MKNVMLIDAEGVKELGYVHDNVLPKTIEVTIRRVQHGMLRPVMGKKAYNDLVDKVSASLPPTPVIVPLDDDTKELINDYIQPYLAACVDYRILMPLTYRSRSKSVGKGTDENHTPVEKTELIALKDQLASDVDSFRESLLEKLLDIENCICDDNEDGTHHRNSRGKELVSTRSLKFR